MNTETARLHARLDALIASGAGDGDEADAVREQIHDLDRAQARLARDPQTDHGNGD